MIKGDILFCDKCSNPMIKITDNEKANPGQLAFVVRQNNMIVKNGILWTGKNEWFFFCKQECCKSYYKNDLGVNWDSEENKKMREVLKGVKAQIPTMAKQTAQQIDKFVKELNKHKK